MERTFHVTGMTCNHCKNAVEKIVSHVAGVDKALAIPSENKLVITGNADAAEIKAAVEKLGYHFVD